MNDASEFIGYGRQSIDEADVEAVAEVLRSPLLTQGPTLEVFERELARATGAKFAVAVSSGTSALHLAMLAAGVTSHTVVATSTLTFVASANCALYCGGSVRLLDPNLETGCLKADVVEALAEETSRPSVLIPVHYAGLAVDMEKIRAAWKGNLIVEDACHALGATYEDGTPVGSCRYADMAVFSFHPVKSITTAEGGAVVTNDEGYAQRLRLFREHGIERERERLHHGHCGAGPIAAEPWYYEQQVLGYNYRLNELQAALGVSQLGRLREFIERRRSIARYYDSRFQGMGWIRPLQVTARERVRSSHHLYPVLIDYPALKLTRREVMERLRERGIGTQVHYIPIHHHPYHRNNLQVSWSSLARADILYESLLSLPLYPALRDSQVDRVVEAVRELAG